MLVTLQGFGDFKIEEDRYQDFVDTLDLDMDLFLFLINMKKEGEQPKLSINFERILVEGLQPTGELTTKIGMKRFDILLNKQIIKH